MATLSGKEFFGGKPASNTTASSPSPLDGFSIIDRLGAAFNKRTDNATEAQRKAIDGKQSLGSAALQTLGQGAGFIGDIGTEVLKTVTPQPIKDAAKTAIGAAAGIKPIQDLTQAYADWAEQHLEAAANLESTGLLASLFPAGKVAALGMKGAAKTAEVGANMTAVGARKATDLAGQGIEATGQKIQQTVIKPSSRDLADGFKIENIGKYDLGGSLPETVAKTHTKLNELSQQLAAKLKDSNTGINLNDTYAETVKRLTAGKDRAFGDNAAIARVLENLKSEVETVAGPNGMVDLVQGTNVKRGAGNKGAWSFNRPEADASAIEKVYNEFYDVLKGNIEKAAPEGVREINQQLSELIPIQNAALRRLPVEQRNQAIGLTDSIGLFSAVFDPRALLILGATKASKSGRVGNVLQKTGAAMQKK